MTDEYKRICCVQTKPKRPDCKVRAHLLIGQVIFSTQHVLAQDAAHLFRLLEAGAVGRVLKGIKPLDGGLKGLYIFFCKRIGDLVIISALQYVNRDLQPGPPWRYSSTGLRSFPPCRNMPWRMPLISTKIFSLRIAFMFFSLSCRLPFSRVPPPGGGGTRPPSARTGRGWERGGGL